MSYFDRAVNVSIEVAPHDLLEKNIGIQKAKHSVEKETPTIRRFDYNEYYFFYSSLFIALFIALSKFY